MGSRMIDHYIPRDIPNDAKTVMGYRLKATRNIMVEPQSILISTFLDLFNFSCFK